MLSIEIQKRPYESELEFQRRIVYGKLVDKTVDADYSEIGEALYGQSLSADTVRRMIYGSKRTLDAIERDMSLGAQCGSRSDCMCEHDGCNVKDDSSDEIALLDEKSRELQKERMKLQTEKTEYNRWLRDDAREELYWQKIESSIREHINDAPMPADVPISYGGRSAALCLSDMHFGKEFKIYGFKDELLNEYSPEVFYERMEQILCETVDMVKREGISVLRVYNLGDSVDGFLRHKQAWTLRYGVIDSAIIFGSFMGNWLLRLSEHVNVVYAQVDGNHDEIRLLDGRKGHHTNESAGKIVKTCIRLRNEGNPNFRMLENKTGLIYDELSGFGVLGIHGEVKDKARALEDYANLYNVSISYLLAGHTHSGEYASCGSRKAAIRVGSIIGIDDFSMSIRKRSDATATILIFEERKGKVSEHTIVLN